MALVKSHHQMLASSSTCSSSPSASLQRQPPAPPPSSSTSCLADQPSPAKRKRRPPGTPDPDAEVVALAPRTLLESDRYLCEICGQGFQREQNLQMHRRRHKVPWRLVKRAAGGEDGTGAGGNGGGGGGAAGARKRVFVCPEPSCLHHDPAHALGDLVGIKKHFRRKHGGRRQWVCARCAKGYAVQSDYKAHLKTCGTRGHSCDCGRVFSRVESFIEHQDACNSVRMRGEVVPVPSTLPVIRPAPAPRPPPAVVPPQPPPPELQLLPASTTAPLTATTAFSTITTTSHEPHATTTKLQLSIGPIAASNGIAAAAAATAVDEEMEQAMEEKAAADAARERARVEAAAAERALEEARRARQRARAELEKACALRDHAARLLAQVTCHACRQRSLAISLAVAAGGEGHGGPAVACDPMRGGGVGAGI
ncbi:protein indeterminate-domain 16-like [Phragmites australis]|uniref:protein indeterminate-domain 16-like n=1 Tax=Phragmites australis TaxID=29695 RepID=UPI002D76D475|nr:protein indeterminate-domain 16-like [Phragmites australis]